MGLGDLHINFKATNCELEIQKLWTLVRSLEQKLYNSGPGGGPCCYSDAQVLAVLAPLFVDTPSVDLSYDAINRSVSAAVKTPWLRGQFSASGGIVYNAATGEFSLSYQPQPVALQAGSGVTLTGEGTTQSPWVISATAVGGTTYTDEMAQDAVGTILNPVEFSYNDEAPFISINKIHWNKITDAPPFLLTETDPTVPAHVKAITQTQLTNWTTAYSWGNHADAGYLTSFTEIDPTVPGWVKAIPMGAALGDFLSWDGVAWISKSVPNPTWANLEGKPNGGNFIWNQYTADQSADFRIAGMGRFKSATTTHYIAIGAPEIGASYINWNTGDSYVGVADNTYAAAGLRTSFFLNSTYPIVFGYNAAIEYGRFTTDGRLGIGTNNPQHTLDVNGSTRIVGPAGAQSLLITDGVNANLRVGFDAGDKIRIGGHQDHVISFGGFVGGGNTFNRWMYIAENSVVMSTDTVLMLAKRTTDLAGPYTGGKMFYREDLEKFRGSIGGVWKNFLMEGDIANGGNFIWNQSASKQDASFRITGQASIASASMSEIGRMYYSQGDHTALVLSMNEFGGTKDYGPSTAPRLRLFGYGSAAYGDLDFAVDGVTRFKSTNTYALDVNGTGRFYSSYGSVVVSTADNDSRIAFRNGVRNAEVHINSSGQLVWNADDSIFIGNSGSSTHFGNYNGSSFAATIDSPNRRLGVNVGLAGPQYTLDVNGTGRIYDTIFDRKDGYDARVTINAQYDNAFLYYNTNAGVNKAYERVTSSGQIYRAANSQYFTSLVGIVYASMGGDYTLDVNGTLAVATVPNATVDPDKLLVHDGVQVKYMTKAQLGIGAAGPTPSLQAVTDVGNVTTNYIRAAQGFQSIGTADASFLGVRYSTAYGALTTFYTSGAINATDHVWVSGLMANSSDYVIASSPDYTNWGKHLTIKGDGKVLVGYTASQGPHKLQVAGPAYIAGRNNDDPNLLEVRQYDGSTGGVVASSGVWVSQYGELRVAVPTRSSNALLHIGNGNVTIDKFTNANQPFAGTGAAFFDGAGTMAKAPLLWMTDTKSLHWFDGNGITNPNEYKLIVGYPASQGNYALQVRGNYFSNATIYLKDDTTQDSIYFDPTYNRGYMNIYGGRNSQLQIEHREATMDGRFLHMQDNPTGGYMRFAGGASADFMPVFVAQGSTTYDLFQLNYTVRDDNSAHPGIVLSTSLLTGPVTNKAILSVSTYGNEKLRVTGDGKMLVGYTASQHDALLQVNGHAFVGQKMLIGNADQGNWSLQTPNFVAIHGGLTSTIMGYLVLDKPKAPTGQTYMLTINDAGSVSSQAMPSGGGSDTNFATNDLTATANRVHAFDTYGFKITKGLNSHLSYQTRTTGDTGTTFDLYTKGTTYNGELWLASDYYELFQSQNGSSGRYIQDRRWMSTNSDTQTGTVNKAVRGTYTTGYTLYSGTTAALSYSMLERYDNTLNIGGAFRADDLGVHLVVGTATLQSPKYVTWLYEGKLLVNRTFSVSDSPAGPYITQLDGHTRVLNGHLHTDGLRLGYRATGGTAGTSMSDTDAVLHLQDITGSTNIGITLPAVADWAGRVFIVINQNTNPTYNYNWGFSVEKADGTAVNCDRGKSYMLVSNGTKWIVVSIT